MQLKPCWHATYPTKGSLHYRTIPTTYFPYEMCARNEFYSCQTIKKNLQTEKTHKVFSSFNFPRLVSFIYLCILFLHLISFYTHKKLKKAYPKSVCPAFAFYKEWYKNGRRKCQWPETAPYWVEEGTGEVMGEPTNCWPIYMNFFLILRWFLEVCIRLETLHSDSVVSE